MGGLLQWHVVLWQVLLVSHHSRTFVLLYILTPLLLLSYIFSYNVGGLHARAAAMRSYLLFLPSRLRCTNGFGGSHVWEVRLHLPRTVGITRLCVILDLIFLPLQVPPLMPQPLPHLLRFPSLTTCQAAPVNGDSRHLRFATCWCGFRFAADLSTCGWQLPSNYLIAHHLGWQDRTLAPLKVPTSIAVVAVIAMIAGLAAY